MKSTMALNFYYALVGKPVEPTCSCIKCDNSNCLGLKRQEAENAHETCSCEECAEPMTCLLYTKTNKHSVGTNASVPPDTNIAPATGDGYETSFNTCCDGQSKLQTPGYVLTLPKFSSADDVSVKTKCPSSGFVLEILKNKFDSPGRVCADPKKISKQNDCANNNSSNRYEKESPACELISTESTSRGCCHIKPLSKYKSPAYVLEPPKHSSKYNEYNKPKTTSKNKPELMQCKLSQTFSHECDHNSQNYVSSYVLDLRKQSSIQSSNECHKSTKNKEHEPTKYSQKQQLQKICHTSCCPTSKPPVRENSCTCELENDKYKSQTINKYDLYGRVLDLPIHSPKHNDHDCNKGKRRNDTANTKSESRGFVLDLPCPAKVIQTHKSPKITTCSSDISPTPKHEKYCSCPLPEYFKGDGSTSFIEAYGRMKKKPITSNELHEVSYLTEPERKQGSKITSPEVMYAIMTDTLKKQESVIENQKDAYLSAPANEYSSTNNNKKISSQAAVYATMTEQQKQQSNAVEKLKVCYLPKYSHHCTSKSCSKNMSTSKQNQRTNQNKETKKLSSQMLCKYAQTSSKLCRKESRAKSSESYTCESIKKCVEEKCSCKRSQSKKNVQIYRCTNENMQNACRNNHGSWNHLNGVPDCGKLDIKKQGSKENQTEIQYYPYARSSYNSEKAIEATDSNVRKGSSLTIAFKMISDLSKTSSSSKTKAVLGSDKNIQPLNYNKLAAKRFTSETMHSFFNRHSSECHDLLKKKYESPSYSVKSQQYSPTKNAQELFKNLLLTHGDAIETLINEYQKKCESNTLTKYMESESSGYLNDPLSSLISITRSLCRNSPRSNSKSSGCLSKQQIYRTSVHESTRNTKTFSINRVETKMMPSFESKDSAKQRYISTEYESKNGYVFELPKYVPSKQKSSCKCHELGKKKSEACGYELELHKHDKHQKKKCDCSEIRKNKSDRPGRGSKISNESSGYVFELPRKKSKCHSSSSTKLTKQRSKCHHKAAFDSDVSSKSSSCQWGRTSSEYRHKRPVDSGILSCCSPYVLARKPSKGPYKTPTGSDILSCSSPAVLVKKSSKYRHIAPHSSEVLSRCSPTTLANKSSKHKATSGSKVTSAPTKKSSKCRHKEADNFEVSIHKLASKSIQSDIQNVCRNAAGTQTDILEKLDLQHLNSENTINLCKDILKTQIHTIEVLKKIYFPLTSGVNSTHKIESSKNTCTSLPSSIETNDNTKKRTLLPETGKLSAQLLTQTPFTEFSDCVVCKQSNTSMRPKKISRYDILNRLKEAYKACSCKICECVTDKVAKVDVCKCKPCECVECKSSFLSQDIDDQQICDCKPCDCVQCTKHLAEQLHKDSTHGSVGKTKKVHHGQTLVVAPVEIEDNVRRVACNCSPCACIDCRLANPLGSSSLINDMSTSIHRHALCRCEICLNQNCDQSGFDSCRCQKRQVMSKPIENSTQDYDIRTAVIVHSKPIFQRVAGNDSVAMLSSYPSSENRQSKSKTCNCKECECISCVNQNDLNNTIKSCQFLSNNARARSNSDFNDHDVDCEFKLPCEDQTLKNNESRVYFCNTCGLNSESRLKNSAEGAENLHTFERRSSDGTYYYGPPTEVPIVLHPFKKGDVLTPSTHKLKVLNLIKQRQDLEPCPKPEVTSNSESNSTQQDVNIFQKLNTSNKLGKIAQVNMYMNDFKPIFIDKRKTLKYDAYMYCHEINKRNSLYENIAMVKNDISGSCFSDHSLYCYKDSVSNNKSRVSSYHSSVLNCADFLIQIRKETIETNLKDLMNLDKDETTKLDKCNIIPTSIEKHNVDNILIKKLSGGIDQTNHSENAVITSFQKFGIRNNIHVQLSNKHDNCENNGIKNLERDSVDGNCEYFNAFNELNELHVAHNVFDYNIPARHSVTKLDEHSSLVRSNEILNGNDYYKRVANTLNEARQFSLELIRLLKMYEKANKEFVSVSESLKSSHEGLFGSDFIRGK